MFNYNLMPVMPRLRRIIQVMRSTDLEMRSCGSISTEFNPKFMVHC